VSVSDALYLFGSFDELIRSYMESKNQKQKNPNYHCNSLRICLSSGRQARPAPEFPHESLQLASKRLTIFTFNLLGVKFSEIPMSVAVTFPQPAHPFATPFFVMLRPPHTLHLALPLRFQPNCLESTCHNQLLASDLALSFSNLSEPVIIYSAFPYCLQELSYS
jgi:hypothetical protein